MASNDTNPEVIPDILISLESDNYEDLTETISIFPTKPSMINLQLSLGGSYIDTNNCSKMKRSYLEQNENMDLADQVEEEEIIMINNVQTITAVPEGNNNNNGNDKRPKPSKKKHCVDPEWAAESVSKHPSLLKAIKMIKSEVDHHCNLSAITSTQRDTLHKPHATKAKHEDPLVKRIRSGYVADSEIELIKNMPTVATDGGMGDGRMVKGILYKYIAYEEVVIICTCHGHFLSPREFVMHAGGGEGVDNPMRLITIVNCPTN